ncbi:MAG: hypothetical protein AB7O26_15995 [Planctomycetaceae bacterium]
MNGNHPLFPKVRPGQRIAADYLNNVTDALERIGRFGDHVNGLATSAGVHRRQYDDGPKFRTFQLEDRLSRSISTTAKRMAWDGEEWVEQGEVVTLYGDFFRGYGFAGDIVQANFQSVPARWYATGSGHTLIRGKLAYELLSGGSGTLDVWEWDPDEQIWSESDPLKQVPIWEAVGLEEQLELETLVLCSWHEQGEIWIATGAACPAT